MTIPNQNSQGSGTKKVLIGVGIGIVALIVGVIAWMLWFGHPHFSQAEVEKSASHFVDIQLPSGCEWDWSAHYRSIDNERDVYINMEEPSKLKIALDYRPETSCKSNSELLLKHLKDKRGEAFEKPENQFTKEIGGEPVLFTTDTGKPDCLLYGAIVTKKGVGVKIKVDERGSDPHDKDKELKDMDQFWTCVKGWRNN